MSPIGVVLKQERCHLTMALLALNLWLVTMVKSARVDESPSLNPWHPHCENITILGSEIDTKFEALKKCEVIVGHLRLHRCTLPEDASLSLLTQVTDYIILERVRGLRSLATLFPRLSVVRGQRHYYNHLALVILANKDLQEVGPLCLRHVFGSVHIEDNILFFPGNKSQLEQVTHYEYREFNYFKNNREFCPFTSCEEGEKCAAKPNSWTSQTCPSASHESDCHPQCLAGCFKANDAAACVACRNFISGERVCVETCSGETHLEYMNYSCVSYEECVEHGRAILSPAGRSNSTELSKCVKECPEDYKNRLKKCVPACGSSNLTSANLGYHLRHCTRIEGNLIISVSRGENVTRQLEKNLFNIEVITGYLMVVDAYSLFSLSFLRNLKEIEGKDTVYGYTFYVYENQNLQELFPMKKSKLNIVGSVKIQFNLLLCPSEIESFKRITDLNWQNITSGHNGRKAKCDIFDTHLKAIPGSENGHMVLSWKSVNCGLDPRIIPMYEVFYRALDGPVDQSISRFQERDVCNDERLWKRKLHVLKGTPKLSFCTSFEVTCLQPGTSYAFYVRSVSVQKKNDKIITSNITYATTYNENPLRPRKINVTFEDSAMTISLTPSSAALDEYYEIIVTLEDNPLDSGVVLSENCSISGQDFSMEDESEIIEEPKKTPEKSCSCSHSSSCKDLIVEETIKKIRLKSMELDNFIILHKTTKARPKRSSTLSSNHSVTDDAPPSFDYKRACKRRASRESDCPSPVIDYTNTTLKFYYVIPVTNWTKGNNVSRLSTRTSEKRISINMPPQSDFRTKQLKVKVMVRACVNEMHSCRPLNSSKACALCSPFRNLTTYKTDFSQNEFDVIPWKKEKGEVKILPGTCQNPLCGNLNVVTGEDLALSVNAHNFSRKYNQRTLNVTWTFPKELEDIYLGYRIVYHVIGSLEKEVAICIPKADSKSTSGRVSLEVTSGREYCFAVSMVTVARSTHINGKCVSLKEDETNGSVVYLQWIFVSVLIVIVGYIISFGIWKRIRKENRMETPNPNYGYGFLKEVADNFRLPAKQLIIHNDKLGKGSYGIVYKGFVRREESSVEGSVVETPVAVKTTNQEKDPQLRQNRNEALREEAIAMQNFDSNFLVKLIAVVEEVTRFDVMREPSIYVAIELMDMDLESYLKSSEKPLTGQEIVQMAVQVADGMAYLVSQNYLHRDLACRNCMVAFNNEVTWIKIGDFGLARSPESDNYYFSGKRACNLLPVRGMDPENFKQRSKISFPSDVFSFGTVLLDIASKQLPNENKPEETVSKKELDYSACQSSFILGLIKVCHNLNPARRPTFLQIVNVLLHNSSSPPSKFFREWFRDKSYYDSLEDSSKKTLSEELSALTTLIHPYHPLSESSRSAIEKKDFEADD